MRDYSGYSTHFGSFVKERIDAKYKRMDEIVEYSLNKKENGFTIKELSVDFNMSSNGIRKNVIELVTNGRLAVRPKKDGKSLVYIHPSFLNGEVSPGKSLKIIEEAKKDCGGKEINNPKNIHSCNQGDVIWISSRSGDGMYFRYLVMSPWDKKASVLGVFDEGCSNLNLNDPNQIYIGDDPESGKKLYADITNYCSRYYKQFGEKCMHITKDRMDDVKSRLSRVMRLDNTMNSAEVQKLNHDIFALKNELTIKSSKLSETVKRLSDVKFEMDQVTKERDDVAGKLVELKLDYKEKLKCIEELKSTISAMEEDAKSNSVEPVQYSDDALAEHVENIMQLHIDRACSETKIGCLENENMFLRSLVNNMVSAMV